MHPRPPARLRSCAILLALAWPLLAPRPADAQPAGGPVVRDGNVGYIDNPIPGTLFRMRVDAGYNNPSANRAEFIYAQSQPGGPGFPRPERSIDAQDISCYFEAAAGQRLSGFLDVPWRLINPEVNANAAGFSDLQAGFKYAFLYEEDLVATFQLRTYLPTGDAHRGLGTRHVSIEPGLLVYAPLIEGLAAVGELRWWAPVGGTDFAGNICRYGLGLQYQLGEAGGVRLTPVAEFVGWTAVSGKVSGVSPDGVPFVEGAAGQTVINAKLGTRVGIGEHVDVYAGYGRALTGNRWYEDTFRLELRLMY